MQIERIRPMSVRVTFHLMELATLISAARWAVAGGEGELTDEAVHQLRQVLASYDEATERDQERVRSQDIAG